MNSAYLRISGTIDRLSEDFAISQALWVAFLGYEVSLKIVSSLAFAGSLAELFSGLFHKLIVAAVRRAAALWMLSCGHTVAAR